MFSHKCTRTYTFTCGRIKLQHVRFWVIQRIYHSHLQFTHHGIPMELCQGLMHHGGYSSSVVSHTSKVLKTYCCVIRSVKNSTLQLILIGEDNFLTSTWWVYMRQREEYTSMCHMLYIIYTKYFFYVLLSGEYPLTTTMEMRWIGYSDTLLCPALLGLLEIPRMEVQDTPSIWRCFCLKTLQILSNSEYWKGLTKIKPLIHLEKCGVF